MSPGKQLIVMAVLMVMIHRISVLSCSLCNEDSCGPVPECSYGLTWSKCGCCSVCAKGPGESCGGSFDFRCASGLVCKRLSCIRWVCDHEIGTCVNPEQDSNKTFWLGGSDISEEGLWKWTNGQVIATRMYPLEYPWRWPGPDGGENENCLEWNGYWFNDAPCNKQLRYICEPDADQDTTTDEPTPAKFNGEYNEHQSGMIWSYSECSYIDYGLHSSSLQDCMNSCSTNHHCTAVTYNNASSECTLRSCPLPVPQPSRNSSDSIGYSLKDVQVYDNDYCNRQSGIYIGSKCLLISEEELNWDEASMACISKGGQLASLQGFRELQLVKNFIHNNQENSIRTTRTSTEKDLVTDSSATSSSSSSNITASEPESVTGSNQSTATAPSNNKGTIWVDEPFSIINIIYG